MKNIDFTCTCGARHELEGGWWNAGTPKGKFRCDCGRKYFWEMVQDYRGGVLERITFFFRKNNGNIVRQFSQRHYG